MLLLGVYTLSAVNAAGFHQRWLDGRSKPAAIVEIVRVNFEPGSCVGFSPDMLQHVTLFEHERYLLHLFYLYDYTYQRMTVAEWLANCDGPLLTYEIRELAGRPEVVLLGREIDSGLYLAVKAKDERYVLPNESSTEQTFYPAKGWTIAQDLHRYGEQLAGLPSDVGVFHDDMTVSTGQSGLLTYGPGAHLDPGEYRLVVGGYAPMVASAWVEIVSDSGHVRHGRFLFWRTRWDTSGILASGYVYLPEEVDDLEVRVSRGSGRTSSDWKGMSWFESTSLCHHGNEAEATKRNDKEPASATQGQEAADWKWLLPVTVLGLFWVVSSRYTGPAYLSDEVGYLSNAALLAGYTIDGSQQLARGRTHCSSAPLQTLLRAGTSLAGRDGAQRGNVGGHLSHVGAPHRPLLPGPPSPPPHRCRGRGCNLPQLAHHVRLCLRNHRHRPRLHARPAHRPAHRLAATRVGHSPLTRRGLPLPGPSHGPGGSSRIDAGPCRHRYARTAVHHTGDAHRARRALILAYRYGLHPWLLDAGTAPGFPVNEHYPSLMSVLSQITRPGFWFETAVGALGQAAIPRCRELRPRSLQLR